MKKYAILLLFVVFCFACGGGEKTDEQKFWKDRLESSALSDSVEVEEFVAGKDQAVVIDVMSNEREQLPASAVIDRIRYIELEFGPKSMLNQIEGMKLHDDQLYVFSRGEVFCFDANNGKFRFKVYNIGRGPNEIIEASDFDIDDNYVYVLDYTRARLCLYSHVGKFVKSIDLPYRIISFKLLDDGNFLFRMSPWNPHVPQIDGYSVVVADSSFRPLQKAFYHYAMNCDRNPYFANKNCRYFAPNFQQDILQYSDGRLHGKYHLEFGDMSADKDMLIKHYGGESWNGEEYWGKYFTRSDCFAAGNYIIQQFWAGPSRPAKCMIIDTRDNRSVLFGSFDYDKQDVFSADFTNWYGWGSDEKSGEFFCPVLPFHVSTLDQNAVKELRKVLPDSLQRMFLVTDEVLSERNHIVAFFTLNDNLMSDALAK